MVQGQVFLGLTLILFNFSSFIIFTFRNYFILCKIVMHVKKATVELVKSPF